MKLIGRRPHFLLLGIVILYFFTRLTNLNILPIFNDESTYIRFGLHQFKEPNHEPYSLRIGKEPLMPILYAFTGEVTGDPLVGARVITVIFGFTTLAGLYIFAKKYISQATAIIVSIMYCLVPYTLFFDRLALMDSPISAIAIWSLFFTQTIATSPQPSPNWRRRNVLDIVLLGLIMGIGLWIKFSAFFYVLLPVIVFIHHGYKHKQKLHDGEYFLSLCLPFVIAFLLYVPLLTHPFYTEHWQLLSQYSYPVSSLLTFPVTVWFSNLSAVLHWLFFYLTPIITILSAGGIVMAGISKKYRLILVWLVIPFIYEVLFAKLFTARHALNLVIPLLLFAAIGIRELLKKKPIAAYGVGGGFVVWSMYINSILVFHPREFPQAFLGRAKTDMLPYTSGFSSGYGVREAIAYIQFKAAKQPISVVIRNDYGNPEDAMVAYLHYSDRIQVYPVNVLPEGMEEVFAMVDTPIYFVSRGQNYAGLEKYFISEERFFKPQEEDFIGVQEMKR